MSVELVSSAVVVIAKRFNPSIVRDSWMIEHGIIKSAEEIQPGYLFSEMMVQFSAPWFHLLIAPEQCQFTPAVDRDEEQSLIVDKVGRIVRTLPHTPYTAIGLNFRYHISPERAEVEALSKRLFFVDDSPLHREFDCDDARFGGYLSRNALGFRLKLDVKPIMLLMDEQEAYRLQLGFNFHLDLGGAPEERVTAIEESLQRWDEVRDEGLRITGAVATGDVQ